MIVSTDILTPALRLAGVLQLSGRTSSITEMIDAFAALNNLIDGWNVDGLTIYGVERHYCTLAASTGAYTIGTGGAFNFSLPNKIESADIVVGLQTHPIRICTAAEWAAVENKGEITNYGPRNLYYESTIPIGNIYIAPLPSGTMQMALYTWSQLTEFVAQSSTILLPPGYQRAIIYNLAVELSLSPRFVRSKLDPGVAALAKQYKGEIGQWNAIPGYGEAPKAAA